MSRCDAVTAAALKAFEVELLNRCTRKNQERLLELLADNFREFGSSGQTFTREEIVHSLAKERVASIALDRFVAERLGDGVVLVTYRARRHEDGVLVQESLRSSVWVEREDRWQMVFHQGTKV